MRQSEKLRQVGLGVQLRKLREDAGITTRSVASALGISASSVTRNELGHRAPKREEVSALCVLYGVTGEDKQALIEKVGTTSETTAWLAKSSDQLASLIVLEREAKTITNVEVTFVPGLVQTCEYARLALGASLLAGTDLERQVAERVGRQAVLSKPRAPEARLILDEGVLHRTLGCPRIMRGQLEQMLVMQRRDNVSVRVVPFGAEAHPALHGAFALYELADGSSHAVMDGPSLAVFASDPSEVYPLVKTSHTLTKYALDEQDSSELIKSVAGRLGDE